MKHVLFLCHRIPYPPNKGDKIRSYNILKYLSRHHKVALGFLVDEAKDLKHVQTLEKLSENVFFDQISPRSKKVLSTIKAFLTGESISVPYFYSKQLQLELDSFLDRQSIDTVVCSSSPTAEYIFRSRHYPQLLSTTRLVMDFIDVDSQKWRQYAERERFPVSLIYYREAKYLLEFEKRIAQEFDQLLIVSKEEKKLFTSLVPTDNIHAISNGVDLDFFYPGYSPTFSLHLPALVFTGAMDYWPNIDGAIWFSEKVLPLIKVHFPDIRFYLVGSNPAPELKKLEAIQGITVTGFVEDIRDYIIQSDVCVIPLRIARGIQNKVLEAMAMGKAVVSTSEAAEGLKIDMEKDISIQNTAESFASNVVALLKDKEKSKQLGLNARLVMEKNYSWESNLSLLDSLLESPTPVSTSEA